MKKMNYSNYLIRLKGIFIEKRKKLRRRRNYKIHTPGPNHMSQHISYISSAPDINPDIRGTQNIYFPVCSYT